MKHYCKILDPAGSNVLYYVYTPNYYIITIYHVKLCSEPSRVGGIDFAAHTVCFIYFFLIYLKSMNKEKHK